MPYTKETVRALIDAFNVHNYARNTAKTNFALQSRGEEDYIIVSFDKGMNDYQCSRYLDSIKRKIVSEFYGIKEEDTDKVVLNTANLIFDVKSFPFDTSEGVWSRKQGRLEFATCVNQGVIFNLKSHLASSLKKDVLEDMPTCSIFTNAFDKEKYLWHGKFNDKKLRKQFEDMFLLRMKDRYENVPEGLLKVKGNDVYIRNAFDDARFIDSIVQYVTWLTGMHLEVSSNSNRRVKLFKDMIIESIYQSAGVIVNGFMCVSPLDRKEASVLIPIIRSDEGARLLTHKEALKLNYAFDGNVLNDLIGRTQAELSISGESGIYCIDFSNPDISHCVVTKIMKSSAINENHELTIDPELHFRALLPELSVSPVHPSRQELSDTAKEEIAMRFIRKLPLGKNEKLIGEILPYTFSHEGRVKLYSILFSARERDEVYLALSFSSEEIREMESHWCLLHEQYRYPKSQLDSIAASREYPRRADGALGSGGNAPSVESKSSEKKQNTFQKTLSRWSGGSKKNSSVHSPSDDNTGGSAKTSVPLERNDKGHCSMTSSISDPAGYTNKKSLHFRQSSIPDKGLGADKSLDPAAIKSEFSKFLQSKSGPGSIATSGYASMCSSLESLASDNDPTLSNALGRTTSGFLPQLKFKGGFVYVPKLKQEDAVKAKKQILEYFIRHLVFRDDKESERTEMLRLLSTPEGIEKLYSGFSSSHKRERLCSKLHLPSDDGKQLVELVWRALHQVYTKKLYLDSVVAAPDQSRQPGKSDRFSSKFSKESSPGSSGRIKKQLPFVPCPQIQLTEPTSSFAMQHTGARKKVTTVSESSKYPVHRTGAGIGTFASYEKPVMEEGYDKDSAYFTGSPASQRSSTSNTLESNHEGESLRSFKSCTPSISRSPTGSSTSSNKSGGTIVEHDTENKGALCENSPSSQVDLIQLLRAKPSAEHRKFLENLKQQHARDRNQIDYILGLGEMGSSETRGGVHSRFS